MECAGYCLSVQTCYAFQWLTLSKTDARNSCVLLKEDGICYDEDELVEIYVDATGMIPHCPGIVLILYSNIYFISVIKIFIT